MKCTTMQKIFNINHHFHLTQKSKLWTNVKNRNNIIYLFNYSGITTHAFGPKVRNKNSTALDHTDRLLRHVWEHNGERFEKFLTKPSTKNEQQNASFFSFRSKQTKINDVEKIAWKKANSATIGTLAWCSYFNDTKNGSKINKFHFQIAIVSSTLSRWEVISTKSYLGRKKPLDPETCQWFTL